MSAAKEYIILLVLFFGLLYAITYAIMTGFGLLVCTDIQTNSGVNTHYSLSKGCLVEQNGSYESLSSWLGTE